MNRPWDLGSLLDCARDGLHPDQVRSLVREAYDAGQRWAIQTLLDAADHADRVSDFGGNGWRYRRAADHLAAAAQAQPEGDNDGP